LFDVQWAHPVTAEYVLSLIGPSFGEESLAGEVAEKSDFISESSISKRAKCPHKELGRLEGDNLYKCPECGFLVEIRIASEITPEYIHTILSFAFGDYYTDILDAVKKEISDELKASDDPLSDVDMESSSVDDEDTWDGGIKY
jgi:hypothetical protein